MRKRNYFRSGYLTLLLLSGQATAEDAAAGRAGLQLIYRDNTLSADIKDAPLHSVLDELSRQAGITIYSSSIGSNEKIQISFQKLPLEQGIQRILRQNYTLTYRPAGDPSADDSSAAPRVAAIHVLSRGAGRPLPIIPSRPMRSSSRSAGQSVSSSRGTADRSLDTLSVKARKAGKASERIAALEGLANLGKPMETRTAFELALQDEDPQVREAALNMVQNLNLPVSSAVLHTIAREDTKPELRLEAWNAMADQGNPGETINALSEAIKDVQDKQVRIEYGRILDRLKSENPGNPNPQVGQPADGAHPE